MAKTDLADLLAQLDEETRSRWERYLEKVEAEIEEKGPQVARAHLERALEHLLAVGWALHRCYALEEANVIGPLGEAAATIEQLRAVLDEMKKKPEWSQ
jgi:hypothetical protein